MKQLRLSKELSKEEKNAKAKELAYKDVSEMDIQSTFEGKEALSRRFKYHLQRL